MLVLSRKESERIRLGKSIVVTVVRVSGDKVRLGIEAPPDVLVLREELEVHALPQTGTAGVERGSEFLTTDLEIIGTCPELALSTTDIEITGLS